MKLIRETAEEIAREWFNDWAKHDKELADAIEQALRDERERTAKVLEIRASELQAEWDAPPSAENGFIEMTADTPAGYATFYCMNQLRKLATAIRSDEP